MTEHSRYNVGGQEDGGVLKNKLNIDDQKTLKEYSKMQEVIRKGLDNSNGQGRRGSFNVFRFLVELEKKRYVKDLGTRKKCVDEVFIRELNEAESSVLQVL